MTMFSDETLMAFADDELDPATRAAVATAMRDDPEIERRIAGHRALRATVRLAYAAELEQPPPERLLTIVRGRHVKPQPVTDLAAARMPGAGAARASGLTVRPRWQPPLSMAASLLIGVAVGYFVLHRTDPLVASSGGWVAGGMLDAALSRQLGGESAAAAAVHVSLSFVAKSGEYCRVFTLTGAWSPSGVACRQPEAWQIRMLAQDSIPASLDDPPHDAYRTAGSALSPAVLEAVQSQIAGEPLDREGEIHARGQGWRPASP